MTYEIFKEELISLLEERMEADWSLDVRPVLKNNDLWLDGLSILQSSVNISPTIYLNTCYDYYLQGTSIEEVADNVFANLVGNQMQENVDLSFLTDFAKVKEHIIFKLISMKQNQELLSTVPFVPYLDLAVVFCYYLWPNDILPESQRESNASILIRNEMLDMWKVTPKELLSCAKKNTPQLLAPRLHAFSQMIAALADQMSAEEAENLEEMEDMKMYVLTNENQFFGAGVMLYPHILKECAKVMEEDIVILPSSVHEIILVPYKKCLNLSHMSEIVCQVNASCVSQEEILSDHVYYYDRINDRISYS